MLRHPTVLGVPTAIEGEDTDGYMQLITDGTEVDDAVLHLLGRLLDHQSVTVDVGANLGVHSIAAARLASNGRVIAFEPSPTTADHLQRNLGRNNAANVEVRRVALGSKTGELTFFHNTDFAAGSAVVDGSADLMRDNLGLGDVFTVPVTTLDEAAADLPALDLVKIDAEGQDLEVLRGAANTISRLRPVVILEFASYALTMHAQTLPHAALHEIRQQFPELYQVKDGGLMRIATDLDAVSLLYGNATSTPVMDLVGVPAGARLAHHVAELAADEEIVLQPAVADPRDAELVDLRWRVKELIAELAAMRSTVSWQVTRPLRVVRRGVRARRAR